MADITKYEGLSPLDQKVMEAIMAKKVSDATEVEVRGAITSGTTTALFNLGHKIEMKDRQILESKIYIDVRLHFQTITLEEIKNIMDLGSKGEFRVKPDDVVFMSPEKIYGWFKAYKFGVKRDAEKKIIEANQKKEKAKAPTQEEKEKIVMDGVFFAFEDFKRTGEIHDYGNVTYDKLDQMGIIPFTKERKKQIYNEAEEHLKVSKQDDKDFMRGFREMRSEVQNLIKVEAKQIALTLFFKELVEMGVELKALIDEKGEGN